MRDGGLPFGERPLPEISLGILVPIEGLGLLKHATTPPGDHHGGSFPCSRKVLRTFAPDRKGREVFTLPIL